MEDIYLRLVYHVTGLINRSLLYGLEAEKALILPSISLYNVPTFKTVRFQSLLCILLKFLYFCQSNDRPSLATLKICHANDMFLSLLAVDEVPPELQSFASLRSNVTELVNTRWVNIQHKLGPRVRHHLFYSNCTFADTLITA